ncbi:helix-turn-helix domain-containing protein [uncultured Schumannella sp.]|uniref:helix-turn-helix domain-containing protein n=1 Tax=uncultured Schumannella sp. TaxID=1195956 RepID=UPI0025CCEE34|nr:helix-turn-helix transcriptional regulator [uncultured Schumannella sp.]
MPKSAPPSPWRDDLGARVRELRAERQWSQETLAERADIHTAYVSGIERGRRNVSVDNLHRLAVAFDIQVHDLF